MVTLQKQIIYVFNKFTKAFIREVKKENDDVKNILKQNYLCFDKSTDEYIEDFVLQMQRKDIQECLDNNDKHNDIIQNLQVLKDLSISQITSDSKYYYLHVFNMLSKLYDDANKSSDDEKLKNSLKAILVSVLKIINGNYEFDDIIDEIFDDDYVKLIKRINENKVEEVEDDTEDPFNISMLQDSKIGKLAQEISANIDVSQLNGTNMNNINDLFSGENNAMSSIIQQVSSVMSTKMQNGEINQEELMGEAMNMMGNLGNDDMMKNMMNVMQNASSE